MHTTQTGLPSRASSSSLQHWERMSRLVKSGIWFLRAEGLYCNESNQSKGGMKTNRRPHRKLILNPTKLLKWSCAYTWAPWRCVNVNEVSIDSNFAIKSSQRGPRISIKCHFELLCKGEAGPRPQWVATHPERKSLWRELRGNSRMHSMALRRAFNSVGHKGIIMVCIQVKKGAETWKSPANNQNGQLVFFFLESNPKSWLGAMAQALTESFGSFPFIPRGRKWKLQTPPPIRLRCS